MTYSDSKKHFEILNGLRGIGAIMVVIFHLFEIFNGGNHQKQIINHGYLAVDFFFMLSGFVIGYSYDDRWHKISINNYFKRRLIRLHPMIIMGMTIGAICYYLSASTIVFPLINKMPIWKLIGILLKGYFLVPVPLTMDIRGWKEMFPLNGSAWTLFFEYIANILYAFVLHKLSNKTLTVLIFIAGYLTIHLTVFGTKGEIVGGWSLTSEQLQIGITRLLYPFLSGLLLSRIFKPFKIKNAFLWCCILLIAILICPRIGGSHLWMNGIYESIAILFLFPVIVYMGASGKIMNKYTSMICNFLGEISYPLYITHYPLIYIFAAWKVENNIVLTQAFPAMSLVLLLAIIIAFTCYKFYDLPVRRFLTKRQNYTNIEH